MKKMLLLIGLLLMITSMSFAGGNNRSVVKNRSTYVELSNTESDRDDCVKVYVYLKDGKKNEMGNVQVYYYDAWGTPLDVKSSTVIKPQPYEDGTLPTLGSHKAEAYKTSREAIRKRK
jgi:hypothetical protein